jgi:hypothetical protein
MTAQGKYNPYAPRKKAQPLNLVRLDFKPAPEPVVKPKSKWKLVWRDGEISSVSENSNEGIKA